MYRIGSFCADSDRRRVQDVDEDALRRLHRPYGRFDRRHRPTRRLIQPPSPWWNPPR